MLRWERTCTMHCFYLLLPFSIFASVKAQTIVSCAPYTEVQNSDPSQRPSVSDPAVVSLVQQMYAKAGWSLPPNSTINLVATRAASSGQTSQVHITYLPDGEVRYTIAGATGEISTIARLDKVNITRDGKTVLVPTFTALLGFWALPFQGPFHSRLETTLAFAPRTQLPVSTGEQQTDVVFYDEHSYRHDRIRGAGIYASHLVFDPTTMLPTSSTVCVPFPGDLRGHAQLKRLYSGYKVSAGMSYPSQIVTYTNGSITETLNLTDLTVTHE